MAVFQLCVWSYVHGEDFGFTPGSTFRNHSWYGSGDISGARNLILVGHMQPKNPTYDTIASAQWPILLP